MEYNRQNPIEASLRLVTLMVSNNIGNHSWEQLGVVPTSCGYAVLDDKMTLMPSQFAYLSGALLASRQCFAGTFGSATTLDRSS